ncbi:unnamed protein product [Amaranthus hypochondriacus]
MAPGPVLLKERIGGVGGSSPSSSPGFVCEVENHDALGLTNEGQKQMVHADNTLSRKEALTLVDTCGEGSENVGKGPSILHVGNVFHVGTFDTNVKKFVKDRRHKIDRGSNKHVHANCVTQLVTHETPYQERDTINKRKTWDSDVEMEEGDTELKRACIVPSGGSVSQEDKVAGAGVEQSREEQ